MQTLQQIRIQLGGGWMGWKQLSLPSSIRLQHCCEGRKDAKCSTMDPFGSLALDGASPTGLFLSCCSSSLLCCSLCDCEVWGKSLGFPSLLAITWSRLLSIDSRFSTCFPVLEESYVEGIGHCECSCVGRKITALDKRILAADDLVVESSLPLLLLRIIFIFSEERKKDGDKRGPFSGSHSSAGELSFYQKLFFY